MVRTLNQEFAATFTNGCSVADYTASGFVGGVALSENAYSLPSEVVGILTEMCRHPENEKGTVSVWLELRGALTAEQVASRPYLKKKFEDRYVASIPHRFKGSDPLDQRPAVRSKELFAPLMKLCANTWNNKEFEVYLDSQSDEIKDWPSSKSVMFERYCVGPNSFIMRVKVLLSGKALDEALNLINV